MSWQQCSSGNKYDSNSGHAFCIEFIRKRFLRTASNLGHATLVTMVPDGLSQPSLMFACFKNHLLGSSSSQWNLMLGLKWWLIKAVNKYKVFYTTRVCEDDSTIRANCKWSYKDFLLHNPLFEWQKNHTKRANRGCLP